MATPAQRLVLTANGTYPIGGGRPDVVGRLAVQITGTWTGSITFTGALVGTANVGVAVGYTTPVSSTLATTAITANGIVFPIGDGMNVSLVLASFAGTSVIVDVVQLLG